MYANTALKVVVALCLFILHTPIFASSNVTKEQTSVIQESTPSKEYVALVRQWAQITDFSHSAANFASDKITRDLMKDPKYQKLVTPALVTDLKQFFYEQFSSDQMMINLAKLYQNYFSLEEMITLINFYQAPLGQKLIQTNKELTLNSRQMAADILKKHEKAYMEIVAKHVINKSQP